MDGMLSTRPTPSSFVVAGEPVVGDGGSEDTPGLDKQCPSK